MERNKLENEFREKLNSREIKPSEMAWNRLDAMLTAEEKNQNADFLGFILRQVLLGFYSLGLFFLIKKKTQLKSKKGSCN